MKYKYNARPEKMIYLSFGASILLGSIFFALYLAFIRHPVTTTNDFINLLPYFIGTALSGIVLRLFSFLPLWLLQGIIVYKIIPFERWTVARKKLLTSGSFSVLLVLYILIVRLVLLSGNGLQLVRIVIEICCFSVPAIVAIYTVKWLDIYTPTNQYDDLLDN